METQQTFSTPNQDNMKMIQIIILMAALMGCHKTEVEPITPEPPEEKVLNIEWATRIDPNKEIVGTDDTQQYGDWVLVTGDIGDPATIIAFDKKTGDRSWEYTQENALDISTAFIYDNIYLAFTGKKLFAYDLETRKVLWEKRKFINAFKVKNSNELLAIKQDSSGYNLIRLNVKTGEYDLIFNRKGFRMSFPIFTSLNNENMMIFNVTEGGSIPPNLSTQNLVAYNLDKKEVLWEVEEFTENFSSIQYPVIYNDKVITAGDWSIYGFDLNTGKKLWRTEISVKDRTGTFNKTKHILHNGRLYVNDDVDNLVCLNPDTGEILWKNTDAPNCTRNMIYYEKEDVLVYVSWGLGSIMVVDALTGKTLHRERPYDGSNFNNDPVYDPELDMFFTSTYKHAVAFKVKRVE